MNRMGEYLAKKSVNRNAISRKTGITPHRLEDICNKPRVRLMADEVYLIALAIGENPSDVLDFICEGVKLKKKGEE